MAWFESIVDIASLENELKELPIYLKLYNAESNNKIKKVTTVPTICDILNWKNSYKVCLPNIHKLLLFHNTVPFSSATAERTFSGMRRIKTWLRSTMSSNSLNNKMFSMMHKKRIDTVDIKCIAKEFVSRNERRQQYFGKFE